MKFSPSLDGLPRATVKIAFRVGRDELVDAVALMIRDDDIEDVEDQPTKQDVIAKLRGFLQSGGYDKLAFWSDTEEAEPIRKQAEAIVDQLWPELTA